MTTSHNSNRVIIGNSILNYSICFWWIFSVANLFFSALHSLHLSIVYCSVYIFLLLIWFWLSLFFFFFLLIIKCTTHTPLYTHRFYYLFYVSQNCYLFTDSQCIGVLVSYLPLLILYLTAYFSHTFGVNTILKKKKTIMWWYE